MDLLNGSQNVEKMKKNRRRRRILREEWRRQGNEPDFQEKEGKIKRNKIRERGMGSHAFHQPP